jgi:hypothetical protein
VRRTSGVSSRRVDDGLKALPWPLAPSNTKARMFPRSIPVQALLGEISRVAGTQGVSGPPL